MQAVIRIKATRRQTKAAWKRNTESGIVLRGLDQESKKKLLEAARTLGLKAAQIDRRTIRLSDGNHSPGQISIKMSPGNTTCLSRKKEEALDFLKSLIDDGRGNVIVETTQRPSPSKPKIYKEVYRNNSTRQR